MPDVRIPANDRRELRVAHAGELTVGERARVPEAVAVAGAGELGDEDRHQGLADDMPGEIVLGEEADEWVDVVGVAVELLELRGDRRIGCDLLERLLALQAV